MNRALVVVEDTDIHRMLLEDAGKFATGVDGELVLLSLLTEDDLDEGVTTLESIAEVEPFQVEQSQVMEAASEMVDDIAEEVLGDREVATRTVSTVIESNNYADGILAAAEEYDCDQIFISGRRRSPTGKAIFGDTAQAVLLNFDGPVTIRTT